MSVHNILLDFSIEAARLEDENGQKDIFGQLETLLKEYIPNLILATDIKLEDGSLKLLTGNKGTTVSVRMFDRGFITLNIEFYKGGNEESVIDHKVRIISIECIECYYFILAHYIIIVKSLRNSVEKIRSTKNSLTILSYDLFYALLKILRF